MFIWATGKAKHFPVRTPPEFGFERHGSNFSGCSDDVIAQYSLFLTLLTLSDGLLPLWLSLPSFIDIALPVSSGLSQTHSLCFSCNQALPFFPHHIKQIDVYIKAHPEIEKPRQKSWNQKHHSYCFALLLSFLSFTSVLLFKAFLMLHNESASAL